MHTPELILISMALLTIAIISAGLFRHLSIPFTVLLVIIGIGLSELSFFWPALEALQHFQLTPDLVFFIFLPALIFESGLSLNARLLLKDLAPILTLAIPALLISTTLVGIGVWLLLDLPLITALLFGALISATDPVAVVALFKELGAPARLNVLVEGESLFNDATAIVVFGILLTMVIDGSSISVGVTFNAILEFLRVFAGGTLVGVIIGLAVSEMLFRLKSSVSAILTMSVVTAYSSFILAEHSLHVSGVMATIGASVSLNIYGLTRITADVKSILSETWEFVGLVANSMLFLLVGLSINTGNIISHIGIILAVVVVISFARAATVYSLIPLTTRLFKLPRISLPERHIMWWGGLKGGLAIAIALSIPDSLPGKDLLLDLTLGVVLFTLIVNAWSIRPLMQFLKLDALTTEDYSELEQGMNAADKASIRLIDQYKDYDLISDTLYEQLQNEVPETFSADQPELSEAENVRKAKLLALNVESNALDQLHKSGIISQYTLMDIRNTLQQDRDTVANNDTDPEQDDTSNQSIFVSFENALIHFFREKNWAAALLSRYQAKRLEQQLQRNIAGIVMCQSVINFLEKCDDFSENICDQLEKKYLHRLTRRKVRLLQLQDDFPEIYGRMEKALFTKACYVSAQVEVNHKFHSNAIGVKAYSRISDSIHEVLQSLSGTTYLIHKNLKEHIANLPLFSGLSDDVLNILATGLQPVTFLKGDTIIGEGEKGDALYIIDHGHVVVTHRDENGEDITIGTKNESDFFGESALLGDHVRTATVKATSAVTLLRLTRRDVLKLATRHQEIMQRLEEVRESYDN